MKGLSIKVALITLAVILATIIITYLSLTALSPITIAKFYGNVGSYKEAAGFAEMQYQKNGNIQDIVLASDYSAKINDVESVIKYAELALADSEYEAYYSENETRASIMLSHYIKVKYETAGGEVACSQAFKYLVGYKSHNVVETLMVTAYENKDKATLSLILVGLNGLDRTKLSQEEKDVLESDLIIINSAIQ